MEVGAPARREAGDARLVSLVTNPRRALASLGDETRPTAERGDSYAQQTTAGPWVLVFAVVVAFALTPAAGANPSFYRGPAIFGISTGLDGRLLVADSDGASSTA
jgi:hypothetical protein